MVIGYKSIPRSLLGIVALSLFISAIFGILIGLAFPNMISYVNEQTQNSVQHFQISFYEASGRRIILSMCISFIILLIIFVVCETKLEYVELTDNKISICSYRYQSRKSILKRDLTTIMENYSWEDLEYVEIKLVIKYGGIGMGTSKTMYYYLPKYIFHFKDSTTKSFLEWNNPKAAYQILRNKNMEIVTSDEMLDCFEQKELNVYDFFENIYHKNGKNR